MKRCFIEKTKNEDHKERRFIFVLKLKGKRK
ncbi:hypothetical protein CpecG_0826 [Chlamydia pecorum MC/MarsBar]|nr:hypothetical protein CpecG_0826 [Chlamydia pecorum MC/MarsBar]ETF37217.1 hypothetical protein CpecF_0825 [Chlamydia pecorum DBDeUG]